MHFKYSTIMNIVFTTMMFGLGMPILFPYAVIGLINLYVTEKGLLYYSYRQPPNYNNILSNSVINLMQKAPIYMMAIGYWMLSSPQLIDNLHLNKVEQSSDVPANGHTL